MKKEKPVVVRELGPRKQFSAPDFHSVLFEIFPEQDNLSSFHLHFQAGFLYLNGFEDIGFAGRFQFNDFLQAGEPDLASCLHILRLLNENAVGVFQ
nr:hypothetical protein [Prolixibacter sp. NT017]